MGAKDQSLWALLNKRREFENFQPWRDWNPFEINELWLRRTYLRFPFHKYFFGKFPFFCIHPLSSTIKSVISIQRFVSIISFFFMFWVFFNKHISVFHFWYFQEISFFGFTLSFQTWFNSMHYRLRPIKRGQFRSAIFAPHFEGKCHFHFLIHWVLLKSL